MKVIEITITYVRSGIVFYVSEDLEGEHWFFLGSIMSDCIEPEYYESDLNPLIYEIVTENGMTKIKYKTIT